MAYKERIGILIIEDESPARELLKHFLSAKPEVELLGECGDGFCGLKMIRELKPDLILLDVQMPKLTGFELLEVLEEKPEIIFTTAYDHYAIKAFDMNAVDYLLKPFSQERFNEALDKAIVRIKDGLKKDIPVEKISDSIQEEERGISRIVVRKGSAIKFIPVESVNYILAEDDYVMIWHKEGKALKQQTMKFYENNLPGAEFARIHRSAIVQIARIERIEPYGKDTYRAILKDGTSLPVSRAGYKNLKEKVSF